MTENCYPVVINDLAAMPQMNLTAELLVFGSVRVAVALYLIALALRLSARHRRRWPELARAAWTGGFFAFLVHVAAAFHFVHQWSHAEAYEATAQQTQAAIGLTWGGGIYANYLFALVWGCDVAWWWMRPTKYLTRSMVVEWVVQSYLAFIVFNATVVFGGGVTRWAGLAGFVGLGWMLWCVRFSTALERRPATTFLP